MPHKTVNLAILGATGTVGKVMISILEKRNFPIKKLYLLATEHSIGKRMFFQKKIINVEEAENFDFSKVQIALFTAGAKVSFKYVSKARDAGCVVIDNTSQFRYDAEVPLVIPEVNPERIADYTNRYVIANPNCSTIQMLVALNPIYKTVGIDKIHVATYQAVSGSGHLAISELVKQIGELLNGRIATAEIYPCQIAFNVFPQIDTFQDNGFTKEEMKMLWETQKILEDPDIQVTATAVRVPVLYGHSEAVHIETKHNCLAAKARYLLNISPGIKVLDDPKKEIYPTVFEHAIKSDLVYVGRIRNDIGSKKGLNLWIVADNLRKGAALNSIQIAEILLNKYL